MKEIMTRMTDEDVAEAKKVLDEGKMYIGVPTSKKEYIVLYIGTDDDKQDIKSWEKFVGKDGKEDAFNFIKNMIEHIDIYESKVLVSNVTLSDALTVKEFMEYTSEEFDPSFDINDYTV